jgi:hypothetical protein
MNLSAILLTLSVTALWGTDPCVPDQAVYFRMQLKQEAIRSPGHLKLSLALTDSALLAETYSVRMSIWSEQTLVRQQSLTLNPQEPVLFNMACPAVRAHTTLRCRGELCIGEEVLEVKESLLSLWPPPQPLPIPTLPRRIWIFDISGRIQRLCEVLAVDSTDATFQSVRDFSTPEVLIVGENTRTDQLQMLIERFYHSSDSPVMVFLGQTEFPAHADVSITNDTVVSYPVQCDWNHPLLKGLQRRDLMTAVGRCRSLSISKEHHGRLDSVIRAPSPHGREHGSHLCLMHTRNQTQLYCQLPVTQASDPRHVALFRNILVYSLSVLEQRPQGD